MTETLYKDYLPANARIVIDYNAKKEERVKFSYPVETTYKWAVYHNAFPTIMGLFYIVHMIIGFFAFIGIMIYDSVRMYLDTSVVTTETVNMDSISLITPHWRLISMYLFFVPLIITIILALKKEWLASVIPKCGYWTSKLIGFAKHRVFESKDVVKNRVIIPIFSNVYLHYKSNGDFNKYLDKIEIMEIPFEYSIGLPFCKKFIERNQYSFSAVFYFSKKPENGNLKVDFI